MARLKKTILGRLSGTVGDIVFKHSKGKNFVASRPAQYKAPSDPASIERRARFRLTTKFSGTINSVPDLKLTWAKKKPPFQSVHNYVFKSTYPYITHEDVTNAALIVPEFGFQIISDNIVIGPDNISVDLNSIGSGSGIDPLTETSMKLSYLMFMNDPVDNTSELYSFSGSISASIPVNTSDPLSFEIPLSEREKQLLAIYSSRKIFFALLTYDENEDVIRYSKTLVS
jgi:hypothetical protein